MRGIQQSNSEIFSHHVVGIAVQTTEVGRVGEGYEVGRPSF
jgi:hypothetical protein